TIFAVPLKSTSVDSKGKVVLRRFCSDGCVYISWLLRYKMDLSNYEVPRVLVTCRSRMGLIKIIRDLIMGTRREELFNNTCFGGETENVPLYYHMYDNFHIQFEREEFCLVTGLKFGVEYSADYDDEDQPIPFRSRVFPSCLDGKHITEKNVEDLIKSKSFKKLDDDDAVSFCCIGILQDANVKRWLPLYATESTNEDDKNSYSIMGFTWAFKGRVPVERLIPDEVEAGSGWWLSSRAYFDGCVTEAERRPRHLNRQNHYEVPSKLYRDFQEQRSGLDQMMKQGKNIFEKMKKYMEDLNVGTGANREPIIVDQHYGISDLSGFQSIQSPYTSLPPTTELPKKRVGKTKKKCKNDNLSPLNLGNAFAYDNAGGDDVVITGVNCYPRRYNDFTQFILNPYEQMNAWIEILIRSRPQNVDWTVSKSGTECVHIENNRFMIETYPHIIETLDGSTGPYPP
nr:phospholipase-like protein [Tanacetum cinerariifolium]